MAINDVIRKQTTFNTVNKGLVNEHNKHHRHLNFTGGHF